jgi:hypothetical protein
MGDFESPCQYCGEVLWGNFARCYNRCYRRRLRAARAAQRPAHVCACGKSFKPKRSDAFFCSAACKQKAYRRRRGADFGRDDEAGLISP